MTRKEQFEEVSKGVHRLVRDGHMTEKIKQKQEHRQDNHYGGVRNCLRLLNITVARSQQSREKVNYKHKTSELFAEMCTEKGLFLNFLLVRGWTKRGGCRNPTSRPDWTFTSAWARSVPVFHLTTTTAARNVYIIITNFRLLELCSCVQLELCTFDILSMESCVTTHGCFLLFLFYVACLAE